METNGVTAHEIISKKFFCVYIQIRYIVQYVDFVDLDKTGDQETILNVTKQRNDVIIYFFH